MNKNTFALLTLMVALVLGFASCSENSEPEIGSKKEVYNQVISKITSADGEVIYPEVKAGEHVAATATEEDANKYCEYLTGLDCTSASTLLDLGSYGTVKVNSSDKEGVFKTVSFNLSEVEPFVLTIATEEYLMDENFNIASSIFGQKYECNKCGREVYELLLTAEELSHEYVYGCDGTFVPVK